MKLSPSKAVNLVDLDFIKARAQLLDVAAFLDRVERHGQADDFRVDALKRAIQEMNASKMDRVEMMLNSLSDPSLEPLPVAHTKGAAGAFEVPEA